jgi:hypothetical protein
MTNGHVLCSTNAKGANARQTSLQVLLRMLWYALSMMPIPFERLERRKNDHNPPTMAQAKAISQTQIFNSIDAMATKISSGNMAFNV